MVVALDEAYREFVTDPDVPDGIELLGEHPNLVVLRTFSKAYGLAGLRVGYAVTADPAVAAALRQTQVPFAVTPSPRRRRWPASSPRPRATARRVAEVVAERERVAAELARLGYGLPPSQANFVWFPLGPATPTGRRAARSAA